MSTLTATTNSSSMVARRARRFAVVLSFAVVGLLLPTTAAAADATGTCGSAPASAQGTWLYENIASATDVDWYRFDKAYTGYALITLGRLPADYDLYLYGPNSCTTLVTSSHRGGRTYDEIYRYLAAGTYRVRIVGYAGAYNATSSYAVRFKPLAESVQVLSYGAWTDASGYLRLTGEILNNTSSRRRHVQLSATFYNVANVAIGSAVAYPKLQVISARGRAPFEIIARKPSTYHHATITVSRSTVTTDAAIGNLAVTATGSSVDGGGALHYSGTVRNNNTSSVFMVHTMTTLYDQFGQARGFGWAYTNPHGLASGRTGSFDVRTGGNPSPNRVGYTAQGAPRGCAVTPRYDTTTQENFASVPTIARSTASGRVALTFDMGGRMTPAVAILNRLVEYKVCATIFPTGAISRTADGQRALAIVKAHPELFELGNHTMNHCDLVRGGGGAPGGAEATICKGYAPAPTKAQVQYELTQGDYWIRYYTGMPTKRFWRAPYGSYNSTVLAWATEAGWSKHFRWDIDTIDWKPISDGGPTARSMTIKVVDNAKSGSVVLMHLGGFETYDALPAMIDGLRSRGFTLTTLSDMLQ